MFSVTTTLSTCLKGWQVSIFTPSVTQGKIQKFDPAEEGSVVCRRKRGNEGREFPDKPFHLAVGRLKADVNAGHPRDERFRTLIGTSAFASVHLRKEIIPLVDEVKRK